MEIELPAQASRQASVGVGAGVGMGVGVEQHGSERAIRRTARLTDCKSQSQSKRAIPIGIPTTYPQATILYYVITAEQRNSERRAKKERRDCGAIAATFGNVRQGNRQMNGKEGEQQATSDDDDDDDNNNNNIQVPGADRPVPSPLSLRRLNGKDERGLASENDRASRPEPGQARTG
ncbi:hypothetical protein LX32DRAFT_685215 [Colletotrichum zoysiae]|uniref:Uncharacterized protein n=1 Tax=Colletotrichum zoysiae TaxID=1216348 RepID=A0AAD9LWX8_9PEZI|nr:hypothetical protein LX32DRAFT_685215 [Colletotrichum zoysiae]